MRERPQGLLLGRHLGPLCPDRHDLGDASGDLKAARKWISGEFRLKSDIYRGPRSAKTGWEQSQQVAPLLDHFVASRKIAVSSALLIRYLLRLTLCGSGPR
jgi:hypothetical protein